MTERLRIQCRCVDRYDDYRCPNEATNEDGLCDNCRPGGPCLNVRDGQQYLATEVVVLS